MVTDDELYSRRNTSDGSDTLYASTYDATYHSIHGAVQESQHVFIESGLNSFARQNDDPITIFEMGFGTGLNAILSDQWSDSNNRSVFYTGIELHPIPKDLVDKLNYPNILGYPPDRFKTLHEQPPAISSQLSPYFHFSKIHTSIFDFKTDDLFNVIFYDAFGPGSQPELWEERALKIAVDLMAPGAVFTTYCSKGDVRRTLQSLGLEMEKLPGPPGKREILRGIKN